MALNWRKLFYPTASDLFAPHTHIKALADSAITWVPVPNVTARTALVAAAGTVSPTNPVCVIRADAGPGREFEYTTVDNASWVTVAIVDATDTTWSNTPITLEAAVSPFASSGWTGMNVRRRGGVLYINGAVQRASWAAGNVIGTLAVGYRPTVQALGSGCEISTAGVLTCTAAATAGAHTFALTVPL